MEGPEETQPGGPDQTQPGRTEQTETGGPEQTQSAEPGGPAKKGPVREWMETLLIALAVALLIRAFVVQVYLVEGESMEPTLHTAERVLVNKFVFRFRTPAPGEVVVLQDPAQPRRELIKRVIASSGETIEIKKGVAYINGQPLREEYKNTVYTIYADMPPMKVPAGHIFVMGDNRGRSLDSRMIGPIALSKVEGKAFFRFWPLSVMTANLTEPRITER